MKLLSRSRVKEAGRLARVPSVLYNIFLTILKSLLTARLRDRRKVYKLRSAIGRRDL